jgi:hypothetical protein
MPSKIFRFRIPSPRLLLAAALLVPMVGACEDSVGGDELSGRVYGTALAVGAGTARTYVELKNGDPIEVGLAISENALQNLPAGGGDGSGHMNMYEYILTVPREAGATPFKFVELDWNPMGHEPPGIYDKPHFDMHFYTITKAERDAIVPTDAAYAQKAGNLPAREMMPQGYVAPTDLVPGAPPEALAVPRMGMHWLNPASPELHGTPFTQTFIMGSWDGKRIFFEPMITKAYLESKPDFSTQIPTIQRYGTPGFYPGAYSIRWDAQAKEWRIALTQLVKRES